MFLLMPICSLVCSVQHLLREIHVLQEMQLGYESSAFLHNYSIPHRRTGLEEARVKQRRRLIWYMLAAKLCI